MKVRICLLFLSVVLTGCNVSVSTAPPETQPPAEPGTPDQQTAAFEAAKSIVKALDRGEFDQVWEGSSQVLKDSTYKMIFTKAMAATRGNLSQPAPRDAPRIGFAKNIEPNLPERDYSVVEVDTNFGGKIVTEKVVLVREAGQWKLAGYFMKTSTKLNG